MNNVLIGTIFTRRGSPNKKVREFFEAYSLRQFYLFSLGGMDDNYFGCFNLPKSDISKHFEERIHNIFRVHRKTKTKTYFTITAIKTLPEPINWKQFSNSLLISNKEGLQVFDLKLIDVVNLR